MLSAHGRWEDRGGRRSPRAMEGKGADNFHLRLCSIACTYTRVNGRMQARARVQT